MDGEEVRAIINVDRDGVVTFESITDNTEEEKTEAQRAGDWFDARVRVERELGKRQALQTLLQAAEEYVNKSHD